MPAALSAGTAAIHLALRLIGIQPGDIVFSSHSHVFRYLQSHLL